MKKSVTFFLAILLLLGCASGCGIKIKRTDGGSIRQDIVNGVSSLVLDSLSEVLDEDAVEKIIDSLDEDTVKMLEEHIDDIDLDKLEEYIDRDDAEKLEKFINDSVSKLK